MKVCKFLWRRALCLFGASLLLCALGLGLLTRTGPADVSETLRGLYMGQGNQQAGLRSIKVVNEDYVRSLVRDKRALPSMHEEGDYDADNDILDTDVEEDTESDTVDPENDEFQEGDFDYMDLRTNQTANASEAGRPASTTAGMVHSNPVFRKPFQPVMRVSKPVVTLRTWKNESIVEDGMFWSSRLEDILPRGVSDVEVTSFLDRARRLTVQRVEPPTWNRCGRPKNQFIVLSDGTQACARYRAPHDYLVQGEVMSFYLSRLLGIENVPPVCLSPVSRWLEWPALNQSLQEAGWAANATVALIQWIDGLERDKMPSVILDALEHGWNLGPSSSLLKSLDDRQLVELAQWSDLILFDYITGNYDRVASMQDAADREQRPTILQETIHNLVKSRQTQSLWLIDNESGLLDSYSLMYGPGSLEPNQKESRFIKFHIEMLRTMCIFRRETFQRIKWLKNMHVHTAKYLVAFIKKHEPQFKALPSVFNNREFVTNFQRRIVNVYQHMKQCHVL